MQKQYHKTQVLEALLFNLCNLLASSSHEYARERRFLHFMEAFGLYIYSSFFSKPVEKQKFKDQLQHEEYVCVFFCYYLKHKVFPFFNKPCFHWDQARIKKLKLKPNFTVHIIPNITCTNMQCFWSLFYFALLLAYFLPA